MSDVTVSHSIPSDDASRRLTVASADSPGVIHVAVAGNTYTILVGGEQTAGRYCLMDMNVLPGGGPPPHRHDFEEMFMILEGELQFSFRDVTTTLPAGTTLNIPANAPHSFKNVSSEPVRMLCLCTPAGQDEFFLAIGDRVEGCTTPPPILGAAEIAARQQKAMAIAATYRTELLISGQPS